MSPSTNSPGDQFEELAEASYEAMYEARPPMTKECFEASRRYFQLAIDKAGKENDLARVDRLKRRLAEVISIYDRQFRYVGY
jgi:hypothetical protein